MSDNLRLVLVVAATIDKSTIRTVAHTGRYGKQLTDTFKKTNKQFVATDKVLKFTAKIEELNRKVHPRDDHRLTLLARISPTNTAEPTQQWLR